MGRETILEYTTSRGAPLTLDREKGVIRGVKILGLESSNGRQYPTATIKKAAALYESVKVNVNHPQGGQANAPRDYRDRLGALSSIVAREDGLYGDLHFNPKHALAEQLMWDAEHAPANVGLSHNIEGTTRKRGAKVVVESIDRVVSVDLVADPATTRGLYESQTNPSDGDRDMDLAELDLGKLRTARPDLVAAVLDESKHSEEAKTREAETKKLREELDQFKAREALATKKAAADKAIEEAKLPKEVVTDFFREQCLAAADAPALTKLIEDRKAMAKFTPASGGAKSREQRLTEGAGSYESMDAKSFAAAIRN